MKVYMNDWLGKFDLEKVKGYFNHRERRIWMVIGRYNRIYSKCRRKQMDLIQSKFTGLFIYFYPYVHFVCIYILLKTSIVEFNLNIDII